jgi:hypothetical protein
MKRNYISKCGNKKGRIPASYTTCNILQEFNISPPLHQIRPGNPIEDTISVITAIRVKPELWMGSINQRATKTCGGTKVHLQHCKSRELDGDEWSSCPCSFTPVIQFSLTPCMNPRACMDVAERKALFQQVEQTVTYSQYRLSYRGFNYSYWVLRWYQPKK